MDKKIDLALANALIGEIADIEKWVGQAYQGHESDLGNDEVGLALENMKVLISCALSGAYTECCPECGTETEGVTAYFECKGCERIQPACSMCEGSRDGKCYGDCSWLNGVSRFHFDLVSQWKEDHGGDPRKKSKDTVHSEVKCYRQMMEEEKEKTKKCFLCGKEEYEDIGYTVQGKYVCGKHYEELVAVCYKCECGVFYGEAVELEGDGGCFLCKACAEK